MHTIGFTRNINKIPLIIAVFLLLKTSVFGLPSKTVQVIDSANGTNWSFAIAFMNNGATITSAGGTAQVWFASTTALSNTLVNLNNATSNTVATVAQVTLLATNATIQSEIAGLNSTLATNTGGFVETNDTRAITLTSLTASGNIIATGVVGSTLQSTLCLWGTNGQVVGAAYVPIGWTNVTPWICSGLAYTNKGSGSHIYALKQGLYIGFAGVVQQNVSAGYWQLHTNGVDWVGEGNGPWPNGVLPIIPIVWPAKSNDYLDVDCYFGSSGTLTALGAGTFCTIGNATGQ